MPTTPATGQPEIPLTPEVRTAYEAQYAALETAIENTNDPALKASLMESQESVAKVISLDNEARIQQTTAAYQALLKQMSDTNKKLEALQVEIKKTATNIETYAGVLDGIVGVLALVPGI